MLTPEELTALPIFAELPPADLANLARAAADIRLEAGEYAVHEGGESALFIVVSGRIEAVRLADGLEQVVGNRLPGVIFGEVPVVLGTPFPVGFRAAEPSRVMRLGIRDYHALAAAAPKVAQQVAALARERIGGLQDLASRPAEPRLTIVGHRWDMQCGDLRRFLTRNHIVYDWLLPDDADLERRWPGASARLDDHPLIRLKDGTDLTGLPRRELADRLGLQIAPTRDIYDTIIIGGGPAGLAAAVYGASEGLRTLVVEREAPGGQAGTSSRIENYLGFPGGVSGDELAARALQQARRLGAEILVTRAVTGIDPASRTVTLDGGEVVRARTVILATGVAWRRIGLDGFDRLLGRGIHYGASRSEAPYVHGLDVHLIGAGNSAGQAALFFAAHARSVTLVVRGDGLAASMSHYLIEQLRAKPNIRLQARAEVTGVEGTQHLEAVTITSRDTGEAVREASGGLFVFIGADAETEWLPDIVTRNDRGYVLTGDDVVRSGQWPLARDPYLLETSVPGVFACGDVRLAPVKRVAAAVGEGSMAIAFVHQFLAQEQAAPK